MPICIFQVLLQGSVKRIHRELSAHFGTFAKRLENSWSFKSNCVKYSRLFRVDSNSIGEISLESSVLRQILLTVFSEIGMSHCRYFFLSGGV